MKIEIEKIVADEGRKIADAIALKEKLPATKKRQPFLRSIFDGFLSGLNINPELLKMRQEVYERSFDKAKAFFLLNSEARFDDEIIEYLRYRVEIRARYPKKAQKMTLEKKLAFVIDDYAIKFLAEQNIDLD